MGYSYDDEGQEGQDIATWRDGTPAAMARAAAVWAPAAGWAAALATPALDKAERIGALVRLREWIEGDPLWRAEPCGPGLPGAGLREVLADLAGVHGFGGKIAGMIGAIRDAEEAAGKQRTAARRARVASGGQDEGAGGSVGFGRGPVPVWALPPALRPAVAVKCGGRLIAPHRHGLADGAEWWAVGSDGALRAFREVESKSDDGPQIKIRVAAPGAVWIVDRGLDVEHGHEVVTLAWRAEAGPGPADGAGVWRTKTVGRTVIADPRKLVELAQDGAPVTAGDVARSLVDWLADLLTDRTYRTLIGTAAAVAPRLGWIGPDPEPDGWIGPNGKDGAPGWIGCAPGAAPVRLAAPDGLDAMAAALRPAGRADALADVMASATPTLWCAVGAALASPLLRPLGLQGWILDIAGATSGGKTSALTVAASVWGSPESLIRTWRDTDVFVFACASFLGCLPVYLDDTKTETDPKRIARVVYSLTSGTERGRGSADGGVRALRTWRSVGILTGEQPLTSFSSDAGTRARVLPLWGQVFRTADEAERATLAARRSWGHTGAAFVRALCQPGALEHVRGLHDVWAEWLRAELGTGAEGVALRLRLPAAAVLAAVAAAVEWGVLTITAAAWDGMRAALLSSLRAGAADADQPLAALLAAESERMAHPDRWALKGAPVSSADVPAAGWAGVYDPDAGTVYWLPGALDNVLARAGFRPAEVLARWSDRGWRVVDAAGANPRVVVAGSRGRAVGVRLGAALPDHAVPGAPKAIAPFEGRPGRTGQAAPQAPAMGADPSLPDFDGERWMPDRADDN
jgi:hypothetical protein